MTILLSINKHVEMTFLTFIYTTPYIYNYDLFVLFDSYS